MSNQIVRGVFTSDWHYPHLDYDAHQALLRFLRRVKPNILIFGGDIFDFHTLSAKYLPDYMQAGVAVRQEVANGRTLMKETIKAAGSQCTDVRWLDGNHEDRPTKLLLTKAGPLHGFYSFHHDILKLGDLGISKVALYENGNGHFWLGDDHRGLVVCHGWLGARATPGATARAHAQSVDCSVIHGHSHECEATSIPQPKRILWAASAGGLFDLAVLRRQYAVWPKWQQGLAYFEMSAGRCRIVESVPIYQGKALWRGKEL